VRQTDAASCDAASQPQQGLILVDRHLEKNAGTTFRDLLHAAERAGLCFYWGFQQRSQAWINVLAALPNLTAESVAPRLCIEAHTNIDQQVSWLDRLDQLVSLREQFQAARLPVQAPGARLPMAHHRVIARSLPGTPQDEE